MTQKVDQRRLLLLRAASAGLSLEEVSAKLDQRLLDPINDLDWSLWVNFYYPLARTNLVYEQELIYNNRTLSWFASDLKKRYEKHTIS